MKFIDYTSFIAPRGIVDEEYDEQISCALKALANAYDMKIIVNGKIVGDKDVQSAKPLV